MDDQEILPGFDEPDVTSQPKTEPLPPRCSWPGLSWEETVLATTHHQSLPTVKERFVDGGWEFLVEEMPSGRSLWDAWDDAEATAEQRFGWLKQIATMLQKLHEAEAVFEALRPEKITISPEGVARLTDVSDLVPLPVPLQPPLR